MDSFERGCVSVTCQGSRTIYFTQTEYAVSYSADAHQKSGARVARLYLRYHGDCSPSDVCTVHDAHDYKIINNDFRVLVTRDEVWLTTSPVAGNSQLQFFS